jgi:hypothetical protein
MFYQSEQCVVTSKVFSVGTTISYSTLQTIGPELFNYKLAWTINISKLGNKVCIYS